MAIAQLQQGQLFLGTCAPNNTIRNDRSNQFPPPERHSLEHLFPPLPPPFPFPASTCFPQSPPPLRHPPPPFPCPSLLPPALPRVPNAALAALGAGVGADGTAAPAAAAKAHDERAAARNATTTKVTSLFTPPSGSQAKRKLAPFCLPLGI